LNLRVQAYPWHLIEVDQILILLTMKAPVFLILFLGISGVQALHAQKTALLIIDMQEFYFPGGKLQLDNPEEAVMNAGLLLEHFRLFEWPVYHISHQAEEGSAIHYFVQPKEGEPLLTKDRVNAFSGTDLESMLRKDSVDRLVICGMQTHLCVEAAVRAAADLGFECWLASDACATRSLQFGEHIIPARQVHFSTLSTLQGTYAEVSNSQDIIRLLIPARE